VQTQNIPVDVNVTVTLATVALAMFRGDALLRLAAFPILQQVVTHYARVFPWLSPWPNDVIALAVALACLVRASGYWAVWAAAAVVLTVLIDVIRIALPLDQWAYASAELVWFYVQMAAVMFGSLAGRGGAVRPRPPGAAAVDPA
jgi:hypothetical protein